MDIHPIRTEGDYLAALKTVDPYFDTEPDPASEAGEHFEVLLALILAYEARHHPVDPPDPIEAIRGNQIPHGAAGADAQGACADDQPTEPDLRSGAGC